MGVMNNNHVPTANLKQRVTDLVRAGTPHYLIARIIDISPETLNKYYEYELTCGKSEAIERIANKVYEQCLEGNEKSQALYLKTQGANHGWVEKQVVETIDTSVSDDMKAKLADLEEKFKREY